MTKAELLKVLDKELIDDADFTVPTPLNKSQWLCPFSFPISVVVPPKKTRGQEIAETFVRFSDSHLYFSTPESPTAFVCKGDLKSARFHVAAAIDAAIAEAKEAERQ